MLHSCQNPNISCCVSKTYSLCTQASKNITNGVFTDPCQPHVTCGPRPFINTISLPFLLYFRWKSILGKRIYHSEYFLCWYFVFVIEIFCTQCFSRFQAINCNFFLRSIPKLSRLLYIFFFVGNLFLISERKSSPLTNQYMTAFIGILPLIYVITDPMWVGH